MLRLPRLPRSFRWLVILWGGVVFLWISLEDRQTLPVALLGTGSALLVAISQILRRFGGTNIPIRTAWVFAPLTGGLIGAASTVTTGVLMFGKTAIHAHIFLDYPPALIIAMLERMPIWAAAGMLFGAGLLLAIHGIGRETYDERRLS